MKYRKKSVEEVPDEPLGPTPVPKKLISFKGELRELCGDFTGTMEDLNRIIDATKPYRHRGRWVDEE